MAILASTEDGFLGAAEHRGIKRWRLQQNLYDICNSDGLSDGRLIKKLENVSDWVRIGRQVSETLCPVVKFNLFLEPGVCARYCLRIRIDYT
jgi:hypothetical protein